MSDDQSTPVVGEPAADGTTEPVATTAPVSPAGEPVGQPAEQVDIEALRRQLQQTEMERNKLRNDAEKRKQAEDEARLAELSEVDRLKEELKQRDEEKALNEARSFRKKVIDEYPDEVTRKAALKLIEKNEGNLVWRQDVSDFDEAKTDLMGQLDALKEVLSPEGTAPQGSVNANNPAPVSGGVVDRGQLIAEAAAKRDWSKILSSIPSIHAQSESFKNEE